MVSNDVPPSARARRVALVTHGWGHGGGVSSVAEWLRDGLSRTGRYEVDLHDLATARGDGASRLISAPGTWRRRTLMSPRRDGEDRFTHWGASAAEIEFMRYRPRPELTDALETYDVVQVVCGSPAFAAVTMDVRRPVVLQAATLARWERGAAFAGGSGPGNRWRQLMTRATSRVEVRALRSVDAVLVENSVMDSYVRSVGARRVLLAPPGVDTERFSPRPDGWRSEGYLLSVARFNDARKGLERLVEAYARLRELVPDPPRLVLAGRSAPPPSLLALIERLGVSSRVCVRADVPDHELADLYRLASVYVQTSWEEGLGVSVLEAMASGLPVVATETAGTLETIVHGETGWLVPQDPVTVPEITAQRLAQTLLERGAELGTSGRDRCAEKFSSAVTLRRFTDTYDLLLTPAVGRQGYGVGT